MNDPIEWGFSVSASQVDYERIYHEINNLSVLECLCYLEKFREKAPVTYARFKKWIEDNNKWMGCVKL